MTNKEIAFLNFQKMTQRDWQALLQHLAENPRPREDRRIVWRVFESTSDHIRALHREGMTVDAIMKALKVSRNVVTNALK